MSFYVKLCQKMYQPEANSDLKSKKQPKTSSNKYALTAKKNQVPLLLENLTKIDLHQNTKMHRTAHSSTF